jgi:DNA-binding CsgD family transcriptional regulator
MAWTIQVLSHNSTSVGGLCYRDSLAANAGNAAGVGLLARLQQIVSSLRIGGGVMLIEAAADASQGRCWYPAGTAVPQAAAAASLRQFDLPPVMLKFEECLLPEHGSDQPNCSLAFQAEDHTDGSRYVLGVLLDRHRAQTTADDMAAVSSVARPLAECLWQYKVAAQGGLQRELTSPIARNVPWGLIAISSTSRVLAMNAIGREMVENGNALRVEGGRLAFARAATARGFQALMAAVRDGRGVNEDGSDAALPAFDASGRLRFAIRLAPHGSAGHGPGDAAAMALISDLTAPGDINGRILASTFTLSGKETELASLLGNGFNLEEAAQMMDIARNTARIHLSNILHKTGARNQVALARLLARLPTARRTPTPPIQLHS